MKKYLSMALVVVLVGLAFNAFTNREPAGAEVLSEAVGETDWYKDVMENGSEWDKSFLPPAELAGMVPNTLADADPATTTSVINTIAWYVTPVVKFGPNPDDTAGHSEDGNITIETAGGNIVVTCKTEDAACANIKASVAAALEDLEAARGPVTE